MPELEKISQQLAARNIDVIGVNVDTGSTASVRQYAAEKRVTYPIVLGGVPAIEKLFLTDELTVPLSILVDEQGIVRDLIPGWSASTQRKFKTIVESEITKPIMQTK